MLAAVHGKQEAARTLPLCVAHAAAPSSWAAELNQQPFPHQNTFDWHLRRARSVRQWRQPTPPPGCPS
eukprot:6757589-Alexandrium_andersonii.AAC.1